LAQNIELKCECLDPDAVLERALALGARDCGFVEQEDSFFPAPLGRLKLRDFGDGTGELIGYRRADADAARPSNYLISKTAEPSVLKKVLAYALGDAGVVRKRRRLLLFRHTRIHLDQVEGLGSFAELETVISDQTEDEALAELAQVARALHLDRERPIARAYIDLLRETCG
jgi:predicted adenylyl cyclase CyaB